MIEAVLLAFALLALVVVWAARRLVPRPEFEAWKEAARDLRIVTVGGGLNGRLRMVGDLDRLTLDVECDTTEDVPVTKFHLRSHGKIPPKLALRPMALLDWVGLEPSETDLRTGDPVFDKHVRVNGPPDVALAILDAEARALVLDLAVRLKGEVRGGVVEVEVERTLEASELVEISRALLAVAAALQATSVPDSLCLNAENDPIPQVRRNALEALGKFHKQRADHVERLAARATSDPDPAVFLSAVENLMDDAHAREALFRVVEDRKAEESLRVRAFDQFLKRFAYKDAGEVVATALRGKPTALTRRAVETVAAHRDLGHLGALCTVAQTDDPDLARLVAETLAKLRDARAEPCLLELLQRDDLRVKRAAVAALARVGTTKAVEPLLPLTRGFLADPTIKDEAQEAIRWIQGRVAGGDSGALSVIEDRPSDGGLSLPGEGGALSLPGKPEKG